MRLKTMSLGDMQANGYIVSDENTKDAVIFDAGAEAQRFEKYLTENDLKLNAIVLTHAHFDHIGACREIKDKYNVPIIICEGEEDVISNPNINLTDRFVQGYTLEYDKVLKDGEKYSFGNLEFTTIRTPGHTPGCACYYFEKEGIMITGDTIFKLSIGRTDFPLGDTDEMMKSLEKLARMDENIILYPGHGPSSTIGQEKMYNPYMKRV